MELRFPLRGGGDAGEDFQQCRFPGAVAAHDADDVALLDLEAHILEGPEIVGRWHAVCGFLKDLCVRVRPPELARDPALDLVNQHLTIDHAQAVFFREIFYSDDGRHRKSRKLEVGRMIRLRVTSEWRVDGSGGNKN